MTKKVQYGYIFDNLKYPFQSPLKYDQNMMRKGFEKNGLEHYDGKCKRESEDDGAQKIIVQPDSEIKECDSSVNKELLDPIWDNINLCREQ